MGNKMLIDASHPEETRVVVVRGDRVEEFDYESAQRKQLRGNIYLAKVTRVEPSLQAAFVDYGGNRHGFLAFNEIHPDYYQIPVADRQALLAEEAEEESRAAAVEAAEDEDALTEPQEAEASEAEAEAQTDETAGETTESDPLVEVIADPARGEEADENGAEDLEEAVESVGSEDALEEVPARPRRRRRKSYRIQEVIKRNQIILVQVVKEERGNKGAALTTYLSLAGRYTVLMPNTARGGGISRKITNPADRKRLRKIAEEREVPEGMGLIIRTAGATRTKAEIKRDFDYLLRLWEDIRRLTLESTSPALVYEEGNLIKRAIRDLYNSDIDEVLVAGEEAYRDAKNFMRMLMPSHAKNVHLYKDPEPLFMRYKVEQQLNAMFSPYVTLKSGGYIVINQTEALVAIDVNSGKSTREHSIEETALATDLEAAEEIARQLRLRDLAGLIVIDFIDMEERKNNRAVERRLKECLRSDRARIQVGRISPFGLLEMSRQRLRTGVLEGSTTTCTHCQGTGIIRSTESVALYVLRSLEDVLMGGEDAPLKAVTSVDVALYILNRKRSYLDELERRYDTRIEIDASDRLHGANFTIERLEPKSGNGADNVLLKVDWGHRPPGEETEREREPKTTRRRSRGGRRRQSPKNQPVAVQPQDPQPVVAEAEALPSPEASKENGESAQMVAEGDDKPKRRRRGRRGGRGRNGAAQRNATESVAVNGTAAQDEATGRNAAEAITLEGAVADAEAETASTAAQEREEAAPDTQATEPVISQPDESANGQEAPSSEATSPQDSDPAMDIRGEVQVSDSPGETGAETKETNEQEAETATNETVGESSQVEDDDVTPPQKQRGRRGWWQRSLSNK